MTVLGITVAEHGLLNSGLKQKKDINNSMKRQMNKYTTPELHVLKVEMESVLCQSGLVDDLKAGFENWNEDAIEWDN